MGREAITAERAAVVRATLVTAVRSMLINVLDKSMGKGKEKRSAHRHHWG
jgi:hypothetical protein